MVNIISIHLKMQRSTCLGTVRNDVYQYQCQKKVAVEEEDPSRRTSLAVAEEIDLVFEGDEIFIEDERY